jgi:hypothetical protein
MEEKTFWGSIIRGIGAKPYDISAIKGSSGIEHHTLSVGVDQEEKRLILIMKETSARAISLMHADIQSEYPQIKVITAYPIPSGRNIFETTSLSFLLDDSVENLWLGKESELKIRGVLEKIKDRIDLVFPADLKKDWHTDDIRRALRPMAGRKPSDKFHDKYLVLNKIAVRTEFDKGICQIPIYNFTDEEFALLIFAGSELDIKYILNNNGIYQYFFPPPDNVALCLVD